ncbi:MAG: hypothetical protein QUT30_03215 [Acidobacteriota bacterium]|nr:hypothetical protein [Acidobacteriota bacterium]
MIRNPFSADSHRALMLALESARMRLSVAIAEETKSMPRDRWMRYLDTADQIRTLVKKIRAADFKSAPDSRSWIRALDNLENLPIQSRALRLHEILRDIVMKLE